jgi:hypothetical protein
VFLFLFLACCVWNWVEVVDPRLVFIFHNFGRGPHPSLLTQYVLIRTFDFSTEWYRTCVNCGLADLVKILKNLSFPLLVSLVFV